MVTALAQWYGSARMIRDRVAAACKGCETAYIPFGGGLCEVPVIPARTVVVNDLHRHLINLAESVANPVRKRQMQDRLREMVFHPDNLKWAQELCQTVERDGGEYLEWDIAYFCCVWMTRAGSAGTPSEFTGQLSLRWNAGGGDSNKRFRSAIDALDEFHRAMVDRCTFSTLDCFEFFEKCQDREKHVIYADPPFFGPGSKYTHSPKNDKDMEQFHCDLAATLDRFRKARVVVRAYDIPFMRDCYREEDGWKWDCFDGRTQANTPAPEVLIRRN